MWTAELSPFSRRSLFGHPAAPGATAFGPTSAAPENAPTPLSTASTRPGGFCRRDIGSLTAGRKIGSTREIAGLITNNTG